jgi:hypothetical protein
MMTMFEQIYTTGMLVTTQQLALRRNLVQQQTLTATHDKSAAWNGLGSALLSIWRQACATEGIGPATRTQSVIDLGTLATSTDQPYAWLRYISRPGVPADIISLYRS